MSTVCLVLTFVGSAAAAATPLGGFPVQIGRGNDPKAVTVGQPGVVVTLTTGVIVLDANGSIRPGFPLILGDPDSPTPTQFASPAALCDVDGDGSVEILLGGSNRKLYAVTQGGSIAAGYPVLLDGKPRGPAGCLSAGGPRQDVVATTGAGSLVVVSAGRARTVARIGRGAESGVSVADLDRDGKPELIAVGGDSRLWAVDQRGTTLPGFPYKMSFRASGIPAVGDVNDDGAADILVGSQDFKIHAVSSRGEPLSGFPVGTGYRIYGGVALVDLDGDGVLDAVAGSGDKKLYAVKGDGKALPGFPVKLGARVATDCVVGDADRDGKPEIYLTTDAGTVIQVDSRGRKTALSVKGRAIGAPVLADLDANGSPEVIVATKNSVVHALEIGQSGKAEKAVLHWPVPGHDSGHSGRYFPNPPRFKDLSLGAEQPATTDSLQVEYVFVDMDGEPESGTQIRWYLNGTRVPELDNARSVPAQRTRKHERWRYTVQGRDNFRAFGEDGVLTRLSHSPEVEVKNTPPAEPKIALSPEAPHTDATLEVAVTTPSADPDGDNVEYRHAWIRDGKLVKTPASQNRIEGELTRKHQVWTAIVVPFDGEAEGASATANVTILNTAPPAPTVVVDPASPRIVDAARVRVTKQPPDADGDAVTYAYAYRIGGRTLELPASTSVIPPGVLRKHQTASIEVTAHDGEAAGGKTQAEVKAVNTPPPAPKLTIWPTKPNTADDLTIGLLDSAPDADADVVAMRYGWSVDGAPAEHGAVVPHTATRKGQRWQLTVTPFDGEAAGAAVSAQVTIGNTPPVAPVLTLVSYAVATDVAIAPKIAVPAQDDDGDTVRLKYRWLKNGRPARVKESQSALDPKLTQKGETWTLDVVPNDGIADGEPYRIAVRIINSPPTPPRISISNAKPTVRDRVIVKIDAPASDKDRDRLRYRFRWFRDGSPMTSWRERKASLEPGEMKKGEAWRVEVCAYDGESESEPAVAELQVQNHAPDEPAVALRTSRGRTEDDLRCERVSPASDPDGDTLTYRTYWTVDGEPVPLSPDLTTLPSSMTREGQKWTCAVEAYDGRATSKRITSSPQTIANTPPSAPEISIAPAAPATDADLVCQLDRPSSDADLDPITYRYEWRVNGKRVKRRGASGAPANVVLASETRRGQRWECEVTPSDDQTEGRSARVAVTVQNSVPTRPRVRIVPTRPGPGERLICELVEPSKDVDNDRISYRYLWLKDGVVQSFATSSTEVPGRLVKPNDLWTCEVTPADAIATGSKAASADVVVGRVRD